MTPRVPKTRSRAAPPAVTDIRARVLYRDRMMLVLDKPAGIPVHAGPSGKRSLEDSFAALQFEQPRPPALAHRLDRDTSGCLVLGRHRKALRKLGRLFAAGRVEKIYWAVTHGRPRQSEGRIEAPLRKKSERGTGWRMETHAGGAAAVTDYRVLGEAGGLAWLELKPRTGRTHQVRVHCALLGCPVVGDPVYGREPETPVPPLHLHARAVVIPLYPNRDSVAVVAPPPRHMIGALQALGWREEVGVNFAGDSDKVSEP
jgi:tRNA pseudouridine32 synthase/23S rRNA pseudouridine746 synthase/23S rRNA pseudouridine1911/1915/1917 synthase